MAAAQSASYKISEAKAKGSPAGTHHRPATQPNGEMMTIERKGPPLPKDWKTWGVDRYRAWASSHGDTGIYS